MGNIYSRVGAYNSVSALFDNYFDQWWRAEYSAASPNFWETGKNPQTLAQRQTTPTYGIAQYSNLMTYPGVSSLGWAILPRGGRLSSLAHAGATTCTQLSRGCFYGDLGPAWVNSFKSEAMTPIAGTGDPYRAATTLEGAIKITGGGSSTGGANTQAQINGVYWTSPSSNINTCIWSLNGGAAAAGAPVNTIYANNSCANVNTVQPSQNPSYQSLIPFAHGAEFASNSSNGSSGFFLMDSIYGNANHQTACVMGEYGGLEVMDPTCTSAILQVAGGGVQSSVNVKAPSFTDTGLLSQPCLGTDSSGNLQAGTCTAAPTVVQTNQPATYGAHLQDFTSATILMPVSAGLVTTTNGEIGYDSTGLNWHGWVNGADMLLGFLPKTGITNTHCAQFSVSGTTVTLADAGGACTTGGSMVWPSTPGIVYWGSGTAWGGAYNSSTPIPANYLPASLSSSNSVNGTSIPSSATLAYLGASAQTFTNGLTAPTFTSNIATGTAPFTVTSTTPVVNLSIGGNAATATGIAGGVANDIPYQTGAGTTSFVAPVNNAIVVTNGSGVPSESTSLPSGLTIPGYASSSASTTVNSQACALGGTCTIPFQTNSSINTSQAGINLETSTANAAGLTVTPTNSTSNVEKFEITGTYSGTVSSSQVTGGLGYTPANCTAGTASGNCQTNPMTTLGDMEYAAASGVVSRFAGPTGAPSTLYFLTDTTTAGSAAQAEAWTSSIPITALPTGTSSSTVVKGGTITAAGPTGGATSIPILTYNAAGQLTTVTTATPTVSTVQGGTTGQMLYQSAANTTGFVSPASWTTGHTFIPAWVALGSALAPTALDLGTYLASPPAIGVTAPSTGSFTVLNNVYNAADYSGADCGAKINAVDTALGSTGGEIDVTQACGTTWTTQVSLSSGHNLVFTQPGTYTVAGITVLGNNVIDLRGAELQMPTYSSSATAGMFTTYSGSTVAANVTIENGILDGNMANTPTANTCWSGNVCRPGIFIDNGGNSTAANNIHVDNVTLQNFNSNPIAIAGTRGSGYSETPHFPLPDNLYFSNDRFLNNGLDPIFSAGWNRNLSITDSYFKGWGIGLTEDHVAPITTVDLTGYPGTSQFGMTVTGSTFLATTVQYDGFGFSGELGAGGAGWIKDFIWSENHMLDGGTGDGPCLSGVFWDATISLISGSTCSTARWPSAINSAAR